VLHNQGVGAGRRCSERNKCSDYITSAVIKQIIIIKANNNKGKFNFDFI